MTERSLHADWLAQIEISGPFLAEPVLREAFPQGLEGLEAAKRKLFRQAYDEWREAIDLAEEDAAAIHVAWIDLVLRQGLELDDVLTPAADLSNAIVHHVAEHDVTLRPDFVVVGADAESKPLCLIVAYAADVSLSEGLRNDRWAASPAERMVELCRAAGVRLGLVTNGEHWMLIDAPAGGVTSYATWHARLWGQEPVTLQAFINLLGVRRFFVDEQNQLPSLFDRSLEHQDDVTEALGEQVRRAVEVLIQTLDRADADRNRELLAGLEPRDIYEAALTVMMRIVFLLSAEERGLLLMGDERYEANYAVSTLRQQLRNDATEILERRWDAWSRLLSVFRLVYGGVEHEAMRLPALGGSLFDPDRFAFLEGRAKGTHWKTDLASPLPIDNRTVLLLLDAVQLFQGRTLSYRALDVEQIGHVYEGLLERTVARADEVTLDLDATKNAKNPWVTLPELDAATAKGGRALADLLKDRTASAASRITNDLARAVDDASAEKLLMACQGDQPLRDRLKPYFHLIRTDKWGYPLVYPQNSFMVASGSDRREAGAHYTPKSLTEVIVRETLEPIVYIGPAEGQPRESWHLKTAAELLDLKICDPAMGSGAFLVQVCRYLAERVVEAWTQAESEGQVVTAEGVVVENIAGLEPMRRDAEERSIFARRMVAEQCLYGVDLNPLAVELAKLSIWLVTLAKGRPFGFLDHNLRCGDSLLGITSIAQLYHLDLKPTDNAPQNLFAAQVEAGVSNALTLRQNLRARPIRDIRDIEAMASLDEEARESLRLVELAADALIGQILLGSNGVSSTALSVQVSEAFSGDPQRLIGLRTNAENGLKADLPFGKPERRPHHWPLAFPEVFMIGRGGFDAFVGNPPFVGGQLLSGTFGAAYQQYLVKHLTYGEQSSVDLVVFFFLRFFALLDTNGCMGFLARRSIAEGKNRKAGLSELLRKGALIYSANTNIVWPGKASVIVHQVHITNREWRGVRHLNRTPTTLISADLSGGEFVEAKSLHENRHRIFQGSILHGEGFKIEASIAAAWIAEDKSHDQVVQPFIGGGEVNKDPELQPKCWVINFWDWPESRAAQFTRAYAKVVADVKPGRERKDDKGDTATWWIHLRARPELYHAIGRGKLFANHPNGWQDTPTSLTRVLAISTGVTKYPAFTFLPATYVFSNKLCVLADDRASMLGILSSDVHGVWAWRQKTSLGGDLYSLVYAHGNIFETFPFPEGFLVSGNSALEELAETFASSRQSYMSENRKGLTKFYNEFHDPKKTNAALLELRSQQSRINAAVAKCYGWNDLTLECDFHAVGYLPEGKNIRFTVSEPNRQEVLSRLSQLNQTRHAAEINAGLGELTTALLDEGGEEDSPSDLFGGLLPN